MDKSSNIIRKIFTSIIVAALGLAVICILCVINSFSLPFLRNPDNPKYQPPAISLKNDTYTYKGFEYIITGNGIVITDYKGPAERIVIPAVIDKYNVTKIGNSFCKDNQNIKSITFGSKIKYIDSFCCYHCSNLESISFDGPTETIKDSCFVGTALTKVSLPASIRYIGDNSFSNCKDLKTVGFESVYELKIGASAFCNIPIEVLSLPKCTKEIGPHSFAGCKNLSVKDVPDDIEMGPRAFESRTTVRYYNTTKTRWRTTKRYTQSYTHSKTTVKESTTVTSSEESSVTTPDNSVTNPNSENESTTRRRGLFDWGFEIINDLL